MKLHIILATILSCGISFTASAQLKKLAIGDVKAGSGIVKAATANETVNSLERIVQGFDSQLIDRMHNTRKFEIIARSDLKQLDKDDAVAQQGFVVPQADYLLITTVDDFQDYKEELTIQTTGQHLAKRVVRVTAVAKIYDAKKGSLIESTNISRDLVETGAEFNSEKNGKLSDALIAKVIAKISEATANRVSDVIYPAKIIAKTDKQVTINRGDGTAITVGEIWDVFALGEQLTDPDTGQVLERERLHVGQVRITRVNPKTSTAEIIADTGVANGAILQLTTK